MKKMQFLKLSSLTMVAVLTLNSTAFALTFKDVPKDNWATKAISNISDLGYMTGDTNGNFKPAGLIDKFETMKILAAASGFKYTNLTDAEKTYYDRAYDKNKTLLATYSKSFTKWNTSSDREISYLMEKEIIIPEDLKQFVIKGTDGTEKLRALSRSEAAVFLVKLVGKKNDALQTDVLSSPFKDDSSIGKDQKQYVYYLKNKTIVVGDTEGKFNPNAAISRASMAVMLSGVLSLTQATPAPTSNSNVSDVSTISGVFDKNLPQISAVQITLADGKKKFYKLSSYATIYIDEYLKTVSDLKEGMKLSATVMNDGEILGINATSAIVAVPTPAPSTTQTTQTTTAEQTLTVEGTVSNVSAGSTTQTNKTIEITVRILTPKDQIVSETRKFTVSDTAQITRNGLTVSLETVAKDDIATVTFSGSTATKIVCEQKSATLTSAYSEVTGVVTELHLTKGKSYIVITNETTNASEAYNLLTSKLDVYALRIGDKLKLLLNNKEVDSVVSIVAAQGGEVTGYIQSVGVNSIVLRNVATDPVITKEVKLDASTIVTNASNGARVNPTTLTSNLKVLVVYDATATTTAKTITILSN